MNLPENIRTALSTLARDMLGLFLPPVCPACGRKMPEGSGGICTRCQIDMPRTGYSVQFDNPVAQKFWGLVPVVCATSYLFFIHDGGTRRMIHSFKYRGNRRLARTLGEHFGAELAESPLFGDVDVIVPVPLHWRKLLKRGYNQSEYLARGMGRMMNLPVECGCVVRHVHNGSQALTPRQDRWDNVSGIFSVRHAERLRGRHILLVDDVLTTGATIASCAEAIMAAVPDCRLSVATLAVSTLELGLKI